MVSLKETLVLLEDFLGSLEVLQRVLILGRTSLVSCFRGSYKSLERAIKETLTKLRTPGQEYGEFPEYLQELTRVLRALVRPPDKFGMVL